MYIHGNLQLYAFVTLGKKTKRVLYETHLDMDSAEAVDITERTRTELTARDPDIEVLAKFTAYL